MPTLEDEQARRRAAIDAGIASVRLSGLDVPPAYEAEAARYVAGEIAFNELGEFVRSLVLDYLMANPSAEEIEKAAECGRQPGAVGYDETDQLVRRKADGGFEAL